MLPVSGYQCPWLTELIIEYNCPTSLLWKMLAFTLHLLTPVNTHSVKALWFNRAILILIQHMSAGIGSLSNSSICLTYPSVYKSNLLHRHLIPIWSNINYENSLC